MHAMQLILVPSTWSVSCASEILHMLLHRLELLSAEGESRKSHQVLLQYAHHLTIDLWLQWLIPSFDFWLWDCLAFMPCGTKQSLTTCPPLIDLRTCSNYSISLKFPKGNLLCHCTSGLVISQVQALQNMKQKPLRLAVNQDHLETSVHCVASYSGLLPSCSRLLWMKLACKAPTVPTTSSDTFKVHHAAVGFFPVTGSVPSSRRKSKMCGSGRWNS